MMAEITITIRDTGPSSGEFTCDMVRPKRDEDYTPAMALADVACLAMKKATNPDFRRDFAELIKKYPEVDVDWGHG